MDSPGFRILRPVRGLIAAALLLVLGSCYLPDKFDAEIVIDKRGAFGIAFSGELINLPLHRALLLGELGDKDEREKRTQDVWTELENSNLTDIKHLGRSRFSAKYERLGHLGAVRSVYFLRRNAKIMTIEYNSEVEEITVRGAYLRTDQKKQLADMGLSMQGQLRIRTDAKVMQQNADRVVSEGFQTIYIWFIDNIYGPAPKLVIKVTK